MILYCEKIENHRIGNRTPFADVAKSLGWTITIEEENTETAFDGSLWEKGFAPEKPEPTYEEVKATRASLYASQVDPLMAEYNRKKTFNLFEEGEEASLLTEIEKRVAEIKKNNPYPEEDETSDKAF